MIEVILTRGMTFKSLVKYLFVGFLFSVGLIALANGVAALFGHDVVYLHGEVMVGWEGFFTSLAIAPVLSLMLAVLISLFVGFGVWIYTRFAKLKISYKKR